jgi:predicted ArsR family transcriptional regulator
VDDFADQVDGLSALAEPVRRALYGYVVGQPEPVSRDEAARGVGVARHVAKFHLDRLVADGLLAPEYRRPAGRRGPGAGRPAKLYRRSPREFAVSVPPREYGLAAAILADAVAAAARSGEPVLGAVGRAAAAAGRRMGAATALGIGASGRELADVLAAHGYEPRAAADGLVLANCPFHALARDHTELVCGLNVALIAALLAELDHPGTAALDPAPGRCCVVVRT